jgi:hypothetical protein
MGMDIFRAISKRGAFSLAFTFLPLMVSVTIKKVPVRGALRRLTTSFEEHFV